jgi:hypothetical protein
VLLVDLFAPGRHDPRGLHGAVWNEYDDEEYAVPESHPLTVASYLAEKLPEAHVVHLAQRDELPEMPLFLQRRA